MDGHARSSRLHRGFGCVTEQPQQKPASSSSKPLVPLPLAIPMFLGGWGILYHEVYVVEQSEIFLVIVGCWFVGAPLAQLLDILRGVLGGGKG